MVSKIIFAWFIRETDSKHLDLGLSYCVSSVQIYIIDWLCYSLDDVIGCAYIPTWALDPVSGGLSVGVTDGFGVQVDPGRFSVVGEASGLVVGCEDKKKKKLILIRDLINTV